MESKHPPAAAAGDRSSPAAVGSAGLVGVPAAAAAYLRRLESLTPESLPDLERFLAETVRFRDPFHDVTGRAAVLRVFERMFTDLRDVRFVVEAAAGRPELCYARWRFSARLARTGGAALEFPGISEIEFDAAGQVTSHFDIWDPTAAVFDHVPLLGFVLRRLKRRIGGG